MKGAYIRTRDSAEQTQVKEQGNPVGYAEDQVMEKGERAARGTVQQTGKQGEKLISAARERGRVKKEAEAFREKNGEPSASSFSSGTEKTYQPKEQMKNRTGAQTGRTAGRQATGGRETVKKGTQIRELPKQTVKTFDRGEKTIKNSQCFCENFRESGSERHREDNQNSGTNRAQCSPDYGGGCQNCRTGSKGCGVDHAADRRCRKTDGDCGGEGCKSDCKGSSSRS